MSKRRRIEITAFRRRTTFILRDQAEDGSAEPTPIHVDASNPLPADPPQGEQADLNRLQATQPPKDSLARTGSSK